MDKRHGQVIGWFLDFSFFFNLKKKDDGIFTETKRESMARL